MLTEFFRRRSERRLSKFRGGNRSRADAIAEESLYFRRAGDIKGPPAVVGIYCCNVVLIDEEMEPSYRKRARAYRIKKRSDLDPRNVPFGY